MSNCVICNYILSVIGLLVIINLLFKILCILYKTISLYILPNFGSILDPTHYGEWSVVTGPTSGIGRELAIELAKKASNLILIGRNEKLLNDLKSEIEEKYKVKVQLIIKDFTISQDYDVVAKALENLDIGILVNNVGCAHNKITEIYNQDADSFENLLLVNSLSAVMMTKIILPRLLTKKKGIIVNIASASSYVPFHYLGIYPATKMFLNYFNQTMIFEYPFSKYGVYFNCINPFYVATKMSKVRPSFFAPSPSDYAKSAIDTFEYSGDTNGCFIHHILAIFVKCFPLSITNLFTRSSLQTMKDKDQIRRTKKAE